MSEIIVACRSFVGVDLHKTTVTLVAVAPDGTEIARLTINTKCREKIRLWLLGLPGPSHMAVEAVGFVEWFIEYFRPYVDHIDIADATELSNRRGKRRKNDYKDALDVAQRLARGECPCGYIADDELMQLRKLGRHWRQLSKVLALNKQFMKSILLAANLRGPKFDGASAQRWLLAHGHLLKPAQRMAFANFTLVVQLLELQREPLRYAIIMASRSERFAPMTKLLQSVPGIGEIWSCMITAEIGPFNRFPNADALEFWAGLTADLKESALGSVQRRVDALPVRRRAGSHPATPDPQDGRHQRQSQHGNGPTVAPSSVCNGPRQQAVPTRSVPQSQRRCQQGPCGQTRPEDSKGGGMTS
jgi:transposase